MVTTLKIINSVFILFALFIGIKQGRAMFSGKPEMLEMFGHCSIGKTGVMVLGALLVLFPKTFLYGNFITAAGILFIMALHLQDKDLKGCGSAAIFSAVPWSLFICSIHWQSSRDK